MARFRLFDLNEPQRVAVTTTEGPLLILAGAGTGKTRVITARVAYLIAQGVDPAAILAVTFTNKAANEMRERLAGMIARDQAAKVTMSTFHALCVRILRSGIERLGYKKNFSIYDEGDQIGLIKKIIPRPRREMRSSIPISRAARSARRRTPANPCRGKLCCMRSGTLPAGTEDAPTRSISTILLLLTVKLLREHKDLKQQWRQRFRYLMVDEFQDTNRLQTRPHSAPGRQTSQRRRGRRRRPIDLRLARRRSVQHPGIRAAFSRPKVVKLEQNYRSTNAILFTANGLIKNNPRRRPKTALERARRRAKRCG